MARTAKPNPWADTITKAEAFAAEHGLTVELRNPGAPQYQIAQLTGPGVRLVVYPNTSWSGGCHARIRSENSADPVRAAELMIASGWWMRNSGVGELSVTARQLKAYRKATP